MGYSLQGRKESDMTERLHFQFSLSLTDYCYPRRNFELEKTPYSNNQGHDPTYKIQSKRKFPKHKPWFRILFGQMIMHHGPRETVLGN